jgi:hypothetical protein
MAMQIDKIAVTVNKTAVRIKSLADLKVLTHFFIPLVPPLTDPLPQWIHSLDRMTQRQVDQRLGG